MCLAEIVSARMRAAVLLLALALGFGLPARAHADLVVNVEAPGFKLSTTNLIADNPSRPVPFNQSAVKQGVEPSAFGPDPKAPYFTVRFAMPVPPENATNNVAAMTGIDPEVFTHNHSPGFEILPNGDALAVYFST